MASHENTILVNRVLFEQVLENFKIPAIPYQYIVYKHYHDMKWIFNIFKIESFQKSSRWCFYKKSHKFSYTDMCKYFLLGYFEL